MRQNCFDIVVIKEQEVLPKESIQFSEHIHASMFFFYHLSRMLSNNFPIWHVFICFYYGEKNREETIMGEWVRNASMGDLLVIKLWHSTFSLVWMNISGFLICLWKFLKAKLCKFLEISLRKFQFWSFTN